MSQVLDDDGNNIAALISNVEGIILNGTEESNDATNDPSNSDAKPVTTNSQPEAPTGMQCDAKNLYQTKPDSSGKSDWTKEYPAYLEEPAEDADTLKHALLVRNTKNTSGRSKLKIHSIVVQSPVLKKILGDVLEDYPGVTTGLDRLEFAAPFEPFVHRWDRLREATQTEQDPEAKTHLDLLWKTLEVELKDTLKKKEDLLEHGVITMDSIWAIFEPGSLIFSAEDGEERLMRLSSGSYDDDDYWLSCQYMDWDGERFGLEDDNIKISGFKGTTPIKGLCAFPAVCHPYKKQLEQRLLARGKDFETLQGHHYRLYEGIGIEDGICGPIKYNISSRIIIDTAAFNQFKPNHRVNLHYRGDQKLTEKELLMCSPSLRGYSLKDKKWLKFWVNSIKTIAWNDKAFESLVLPADQKELILAFAESQVKHENKFDDVIQGKGKGIIMLLSGPPGVGKTLTAESVAENMRVPLYTLCAGDLGTDTEEVESTISKILALATKWKAVLLLDEADVFLETRSAHDLERNKLVSVFLRVLEYYEGFLFLTTNRVDNIDAAFESRIHLTLQYDELSLSSRYHVWKTFLGVNSSKFSNFSEQHLQELAKTPMNGRQIKNVLKTAQLLASRKGVLLNYDHVEVVTKLRAANARNMPNGVQKTANGST